MSSLGFMWLCFALAFVLVLVRDYQAQYYIDHRFFVEPARLSHAKNHTSHAICLYDNTEQIAQVRQYNTTTPIHFYTTTTKPDTLPPGVIWHQLPDHPKSVWELIVRTPAWNVTWIQQHVLLLQDPVPLDEETHFWWQPNIQRKIGTQPFGTLQQADHNLRTDLFTINKKSGKTAAETIEWALENAKGVLTDGALLTVGWSSTKAPCIYNLWGIGNQHDYIALNTKAQPLALLGPLIQQDFTLIKRPMPQDKTYQVCIAEQPHEDVLINDQQEISFLTTRNTKTLSFV